MRVLLDTHVMLWALTDPAKLSSQAANIIIDANNGLIVSSASLWELGMKHKSGKLPQIGRILARLEHSLARLRAEELQISHIHALKASSLPLHHKDPFDRMLIAQAISEGVPLISGDPVFRHYHVLTVW